MKKILSILFLFLAILPARAQTGIRGAITRIHSNETIAGVTVVADDTLAVTSDSSGSYSLLLMAGKHALAFKMLGFAERKITVEIKSGEMSVQDVALEETAKELGIVVVSAGKFEQRLEDVTVSMEVIKPSLVEDKNTTSMDDIIDQVPGVNVIDGQVNIRGGAGWSYGAGSRVMVLVDDLPELTADASDAKWNFLPVENLEQIEAIKGASSALFGSSALDGVINIRTAYPKDTPVTKMDEFTGMYDTPEPASLKWWGNKTQLTEGADFFHSHKIKNFDLVLGGNFFRDDGYREGEHEERFRFNGNFRYRFLKPEGFAAGVNFNHMKTKGGLFFIWQNDSSGAYRPLGGLDPDSTTISTYITYRTTIDPFVTYLDQRGNSIKLRTRYFNSINQNNTSQESTGNVYYSDLQYQKHFDEWLILTAGVTQTYTRVRAELYGNHDGDNTAFYLQGDFKLKKFSFSLGGRTEQNQVDSQKDKFKPVMRAGLNYHALSETYLRASYGQGYRFPSVAEKFIKTQVGGLPIYPNADVTAESGFSSEVGIMQGIKIGGWNGYADVAGFWTEYKDMIEFAFGKWGLTTDPFFGLGFEALNTGDTRIKGLDFSLSGKGPIGPLNITVLAGYTFMDPVQVRFDSAYIRKTTLPYYSNTTYLGSDSTNFLKYRFNHMVKADVEIAWKIYAVGIGMRYNSFMKNIDELFVDPILGSLITPGVAHYRQTHRGGDTVFDLRASVRFKDGIKISAICKNVFNYVFMQRPADMQPPRMFVIQLGLTL